MYLTDMLQLLRDPQATAMAIGLQTAGDDEALMGAMNRSLDYIHRSCGSTYSGNVHAQLSSLLPLPMLGQLLRPEASAPQG